MIHRDHPLHSHGAPPKEYPNGHNNMPFKHVEWLGKFPCTLLQGCMSSVLYPGWKLHCSSWILGSNNKLSSPAPWSKSFPGPYSWSTHSGLPFWKRGSTTPVCYSRSTVPEVHTVLQQHVSQDNPETCRTLRNSGWISSIPGSLLLRVNCLSDQGPSSPPSPAPLLLVQNACERD